MNTAPASPKASSTAAPDPMLPMPYWVARRYRELADTVTLELTTADGDGGLDFAPGQFTMLYPFGIGEAPISISGDPAKPQRLVHTIRAVGAVSRALTELKRGVMLGVRGPFGVGWPVDQAKGSDVVIVAGGLGLAPLRPALYRVLANRADYGNVCLYYGARTPADILYPRELSDWRGRFDLNVDVTVDRADRRWAGRVGVVTQLLGGDFDPLHAVALVCGPEVMMRFAVAALNERGVEDRQIYVSLERNMQCAIGFCGHCQFGPGFVCKDGPVYRFDRIRSLFGIREL